MKYKLANPKVNIILDELAEEYKDLLIEAALKQYRDIDIENINISELTQIDIETKKHLKNRTINNRIDKTSHLISLVGMIYSLFGLMLIMVTENRNVIMTNPLTTIAIICVFLGFITAIIGFIIRIVYKNKKYPKNYSNNIDYEVQLINIWRTIEALIYQIHPQNDKLSLRSMINNLEQAKILSKGDIKTITILMNYRNKILHNVPGKIEYSDDIKKLLVESQKIIEKLANIV